MDDKINIIKYGNSNKVLLIITGIGGTVNGYQNKYLNLALSAEKLGYTAFIATTPHGSWNNTEYNFNYILSHIKSNMNGLGYNDYKIIAVGHSAGGTFLTWHAYKSSVIIKVLSINPVLSINIHKMIEGLTLFKADLVKIVMGTEDSSFKLFPLLNKAKNKNLKLIKLEKIDHNFTNSIDLFNEIILDFIK